MRRALSVSLLGAAATLFALGPLCVRGYDWLSQSISETAAQNTPGAWVARAGFPVLGLAVLSVLPRVRWGPVSTACYQAFAGGLFAVGTWSHEPYLPGVPYDLREAVLHSVAATAMGVAVVSAEVFAAWHTREGRRLALAAAYLVLPLAMTVHPAWSGLYQRVLFATLICFLVVTVRGRTRSETVESSSGTG